MSYRFAFFKKLFSPIILINWYALGYIKNSPRYNEAQKASKIWLHFAQNETKSEHPKSLYSSKEREIEEEGKQLLIQLSVKSDHSILTKHLILTVGLNL